MVDFLSFSSTGAASTLNAIGKAFAIIEFDASGKIKWANEVFCKAMGYSPSEIKGRHHSMFVDPDYAKSKEYAAFWEKLRSGQHESHEFKRFAKGGKEVWIQASYNPIVSATGRVSRIVKIAADITAAKQKSLLDAGKIAAIDRAQAVIEFMPDGTIVTANSNFLSAVGYKLEEIAGKHHRMFVDPAYAKSHEYAEFWQHLSKGEYQTGEYDRYGKGGKKIWIQASYNPIFDPTGKVTSVVKFATDVTDRVEAVERLASGLGRLAVGDLKEEIATPFPSSIEKLRVDFNKTVASLRDVLSSIGDISNTIDNGAQEIASASDDLSSRTEQNAANLEETAAAIQEITTTVNRSATGAKEASSAVSTAKTDAEQGGAVVSQAIEAMGKIEKSSQEINQIISVIDEIAFQTNLLALNAGVEAARAGEAGRGFAVVASEVRSLAQRSADAAKEIKELISTSTSQVGDGVKLVAETGEALERIVNNIVDINSVVTDIAASAQEQAATLQQVNDAAVRMDQSTQQNAAMSEEATAASRSLAEKSRELAGLINKFELGSNSLRSEMQRAAPHVYGNPNRAA